MALSFFPFSEWSGFFLNEKEGKKTITQIKMVTKMVEITCTRNEKKTGHMFTYLVFFEGDG